MLMKYLGIFQIEISVCENGRYIPKRFIPGYVKEGNCYLETSIWFLHIRYRTCANTNAVIVTPWPNFSGCSCTRENFFGKQNTGKSNR